MALELSGAMLPLAISKLAPHIILPTLTFSGLGLTAYNYYYEWYNQYYLVVDDENETMGFLTRFNKSKGESTYYLLHLELMEFWSRRILVNKDNYDEIFSMILERRAYFTDQIRTAFLYEFLEAPSSVFNERYEYNFLQCLFCELNKDLKYGKSKEQFSQRSEEFKFVTAMILSLRACNNSHVIQTTDNYLDYLIEIFTINFMIVYLYFYVSQFKRGNYFYGSFIEYFMKQSNNNTYLGFDFKDGEFKIKEKKSLPILSRIYSDFEKLTKIKLISLYQTSDSLSYFCPLVDNYMSKYILYLIQQIRDDLQIQRISDINQTVTENQYYITDFEREPYWKSNGDRSSYITYNQTFTFLNRIDEILKKSPYNSINNVVYTPEAKPLLEGNSLLNRIKNILSYISTTSYSSLSWFQFLLSWFQYLLFILSYPFIQLFLLLIGLRVFYTQFLR